jgi:hypothetical protein
MFEIHIPVMYGEGRHAVIRLQKEIQMILLYQQMPMDRAMRPLTPFWTLFAYSNIPTKPDLQGFKMWFKRIEDTYLIFYRFKAHRQDWQDLGVSKTQVVVLELVLQIKDKARIMYLHGQSLYVTRNALFSSKNSCEGTRSKCLDWGDVFAVAKDDVLQFAWKDTQVVLFMTAVHEGHSTVVRPRERPIVRPKTKLLRLWGLLTSKTLLSQLQLIDTTNPTSVTYTATAAYVP